jgi:23S rRNA pseudouridine2605 synthase
VQLHRALSKLGWGSRTQAWDWIRAGHIQVDGRTITDPLTWVDLDRQQITDACRERQIIASLTLALHKPCGLVTTRRDERGRPTVYDLLPPDLPWVFPAGRLDADSEGLLIMTNDSRLAVRLTEPDQHVPKVYEVTLRETPTPATLKALRQGVVLSDGLTRPARVDVIRQGPDGVLVQVVLTEGRNRQVRRMFAACGHRARRLLRVGIGDYRLGNLAASHFRRLNARDLRRLTKSERA